MIQNHSRKISALILAAGASTRMGSPKQLLPYHGKSLLTHTIHNVQTAGFSPIIVVLGHDPTGAIEREAQRSGVQIVFNLQWQRGMGASIHIGLATIVNDASIISLLVLPCDQPFITAAHLEQFRALATPDNMVAAAFNTTIGPPAIFGRRFFPQLAQLPTDQGAKSILLRHPHLLRTLHLPEAAFDMDRPEDLLPT